MKVKLEYVWLDGYTPEPNLRSKVKIVDSNLLYGTTKELIDLIPEWNFDGSSTKQADTGNSDRILKPIRLYKIDLSETIYVLCEVLNPDGTPHESNTRSKLKDEDKKLWFGFEQEYFIREGKNKTILGHNGTIEGQGKYYCGVGSNVVGRDFVEKHTNMCLNYGIDITGTNAEVALGQWEYQVFTEGKLKAGDDLWMSRYFLHKLSEEYGYEIDLHPKPIQHGEWNGSGLHTNFSNNKMREEGGKEYFESLFSSLDTRHWEHIKDYGSSNDMRLTGKYETQSIDKFSWGISDRGASIRVPKSTADNWKGYVEDRRPGSNADPYKIIYQIDKSIKNADTITDIKRKINFKVDINNLNVDFKTLTNEELLSEYKNDENYDVDPKLMVDNENNIQTKEIKFNLNEK